ncbi:hypothetical protein BaRGS_00011538, partial [Batillaria attramentaria]
MAMDSANTSTCTFRVLDKELHADCSHRNLTSLPNTWPANVTLVWLDLRHNRLSTLTHLSNPYLAQLRHLDVSHNLLKGTLAGHTFAQLRQLRWLSLQDNRLQSLQAGAMSGLGQLTFLDLSKNKLKASRHTYPLDIFDPLVSLEELLLYGNDDSWEGKYPDDIFQPLSNLRSLSIDTFSGTESAIFDEHGAFGSQFGPGFAALRNLKLLSLNQGYSNLKYLLNTTLAVFQNTSLEEIHLGSRSLILIEACAFCGFSRLRSLHVNAAKVPVTYALAALYGLQHRNMTVIDFSGLAPGNRRFGTSIERDDTRYLKTICVSRLNIADSRLQGIVHNALFEAGSPFVQCLQEMDISGNRLFGDKVALWLALIAFKRLVRFRIDRQHTYAMETAGCLLRQDRNCKDQGSPAWEDSWEFHMTPSLEYANFSSMGGRWGKLPRILKITPPSRLKVLDLSNCQISGCHTTIIGMPVLETLELSGNYCFNMTETFFDHFRSLLHIRLSNVKVNPDLFTDRAGRVFQNIQLLQTLDLSLNNLIHINPSMLHVQRHLKELNLAGNRLQSLSVDLEPHEDLVLLDLSHNMLSTLLPGERQALDALAARQNFSLRLSGNPFLCSCSNLDFVRWLWTTKVDLDGDSGGISRDYTCTTETGEVSNTLSVMAQYQVHWRLCVGQRVLPVAIAGFLLQLLLLVIVYVLSRSWTHIRYVWKVMCRLRLPRREEFRKDVYVGYADADWELACLRLPACLEERHGVRLLLRDFEEVPGSIRAENIVTHIDDSWKVLLLVTPNFGRDEWLCGFTVHQAQRSITDTMPDRVIVVFMEDPAHLPPMVSLERLLRMVPERN